MPGAPDHEPAAHRYVVRRSDRARRSRLTITRTGELIVVLPRRAPLVEASRLVERHDAWIARHVDRLHAQHARLAARPSLEEGRSLEVEGRALRVVRSEKPGGGTSGPARGSVMQVGEQIVLRPGSDGRGSAELLEGWLRTRARRVLGERVAARALEMGVQPSRVAIRDQVSRWGSASSLGTLSFSWRLILAPPEVLDAVVVHELAHLRIRGHSRHFWDLVERYAPQTPAARAWLRTHAAEVRAALE